MHTTNRTHSEQFIRGALRDIAMALLAGVTCLACGGAVDADEPSVPGPQVPSVPGPDDIGVLGSDDTDAEGTPGASTVHSPISAQIGGTCDEAPSGIRRAANEQEFQGWLVGAWRLCSASSAFGTDEAGLLIDANGRWSKLTLSDGELSVLEGWNNEGGWETIDTSMMNGPGAYQLNLKIDGSGTVMTHPAFAAEPDFMRLDNNGVYRGDYVRVQ